MVSLYNNNKQISAYGQLKKLRTALAISQGTKLLSVLQQEADRTVSHDQTRRVTYLTGLFFRIHRDIFYHWKEQATVNHRPGSIVSADKRKRFRKTVECLVLDGESNKKTAIFDNNGFVFRTDDIAERLANFYYKMRRVRPFSYGNRITLDFFMTALGTLPAFKAVYEQGIDFRRLQAGDAEVMHDISGSRQALVTAFQHALDPMLNKSLQNHPNSYGIWPENKVYISGIPFLSHTTPDGILCLVSVNGGLVPLEHIKEEIFLAGNNFADYPLSVSENVIGYLPGTEVLRGHDIKEIDGIRIGENNTAPLFCLDVNMLTGLRSPSHTELTELIKQCAGKDMPVFALANNEVLKQQLLCAASTDERLQRTVEIAYDRLNLINKKIEQAKNLIFTGKTPVANPSLFLSMGGAGSGKTAVEEIAIAQCGDNFVIASLDEFRKVSDLYKVLTAANHHSDDYVYVEPFANRLRDRVAQQARQQRINLLYDGTGIPYRPRYASIIEQFKKAGFQTQITAVDAYIIKPLGREFELSRTSVIRSVKERFEKTGRALPWVITVFKHLRAPRSFLHAIEDDALDKISLFANDGERNRHYLVAESFDFSESEVRILQQHQMSASLAEYYRFLIKTREDSFLRKLAHQNEPEIDRLIERNPAFTEDNVAYQVYPGKRGFRILAIYHTRRMVDFVEKRQLNPNASGVEGLLHKTEMLAFHVDPASKEPWLIRLQGSLRSYRML